MNEARTGGHRSRLRFSPSSQLGESTAMTLPHSGHGWAQPAPTSVDVAAFTREQLGGLYDTPAGVTDRDALIAHLGRDVLHVSRDRNFAKAYRRTKDGSTVPLMWRTDSEDLGKFQYAMLTNKQYAAVLVVDIDQPGTQGGHPVNLSTCLLYTSPSPRD